MNTIKSQEGDIGIDKTEAKFIYDAKNKARELGYDTPKDYTIIIDRTKWKNVEGGFGGAIDESGNITLGEKNQKAFEEDTVYVDLVTGQAYYRQGHQLIKID